MFDTTPTTSVERILKAFKFNAFPKFNNATYMYFPNLRESVIKRYPFIKSFSFFLAPFFWVLAFLQELNIKKLSDYYNNPYFPINFIETINKFEFLEFKYLLIRI